MASTSEDTKPFDPFEQVTPFFNRAQLYAFQQPPSAEALGRVNRGGSHDYLPQEYVRALLDRFIGPGRWAIRTSLVKTFEEKISKGGKENLALTAVVNAELDILSAVDPDKRLTYAGIGTHTMEAGVDKGVAAVVGNAITSAESKALKAAAKNLGRAFGNDLKNKLDRSTLPPSIAQYAQQMAARFAGQNTGQAALAAPAPDTPETAAAPDGGPAATAVAAAAETQRAVVEPASPAKTENAGRNDAPRDAGTQQERPVQPVAETSEPAIEAQKPQEPAKPTAETAPAGGDKPAEPVQREWELSMDPGTNFDDWIACLQTMARRIGAMNNAREIESFLKRYKNRVQGLPEIPAEGDRPAKNFKARFRRIVAKRYVDLGIEVPADFRDAAPPPAGA